jgi:branched-chain amino acid transport system ATP-binding protein
MNASSATSAEIALRATGVSKSFGGLKAVNNFEIALPKGSLRGLIGPNGAGKTTVFNLLTGVYKRDAGSVTLA